MGLTVVRVEDNEREIALTKHASKYLKGRTIVNVRYMTLEEKELLNWLFRPVVLELDNGTILYPVEDDEGNDGGAVFANTVKEETVTFSTLM
jgi:hypothetical protein